MNADALRSLAAEYQLTFGRENRYRATYPTENADAIALALRLKADILESNDELVEHLARGMYENEWPAGDDYNPEPWDEHDDDGTVKAIWRRAATCALRLLAESER
jgi:hypothetical protein